MPNHDAMQQQIRIPSDRQTWESDIGIYWFDGPILVSLSKPVMRTVDNISANATLIKSITNNKPVRLLIYLAKSPVPDKATRKLSAELVPQMYSAMAMISAAGLSSFIMKLVFRLNPSPIPIRNFTNINDAKQWLLSLNHAQYDV